MSKKLSLKGSWANWSQGQEIPETMAQGISETNSSFCVG